MSPLNILRVTPFQTSGRLPNPHYQKGNLNMTRAQNKLCLSSRAWVVLSQFLSRGFRVDLPNQATLKASSLRLGFALRLKPRVPHPLPLQVTHPLPLQVTPRARLVPHLAHRPPTLHLIQLPPRAVPCPAHMSIRVPTRLLHSLMVMRNK